VQEVDYCLLGDAIGVETARENAADLTTPAQTLDLIVRKQQGFLEEELPIFRGECRGHKGVICNDHKKGDENHE
jgi:hypothetical protein